MILVVGGVASGKRTYARGLAARMGWGEDDLAFDAGPGAQGGLEALLGKKVVTVCETGCGVVPLDAGARARREAAGRMNAELAARAEAVVRMVCGIAVPLKGALPGDGTCPR